MKESIKILIVDDHPIVRQGLASVLEQETDLTVVGQAGTGVEALSKARELSPDIILMDLQMPEMNGVEAISRIMEEGLDTGIIILTTFDTDDYIFRGIEAGARGYLLKDSPPEDVVKAIRTVFQGDSLIQPRAASRLPGHTPFGFPPLVAPIDPKLVWSLLYVRSRPQRRLKRSLPLSG